MAEIYTGADSLRAYLTGAEADGLGQYDHDASLGGFRSNARLSCMTPVRLTAFPGIRLLYVEAANGVGIGRLQATDTGTLRWAAPGEAFGASVSIANGETKLLTSDTASKFIVIRRASALALQGVESIQIGDTFNGLIGMSNFTTAESTAGADKYRALMIRNVGSVNATSVQLWVDGNLDTRIELALETPVSDEIQSIADETTAPTSVTFSAPTSGSPLSIGTLTPDQQVGVWIKRYVGAGATADPAVRANIVLSFVVGGITYIKHFRGVGRIAEAGIAGYLYYWGEGADPDWIGGTPDEFSASIPVTLTKVLTAGVHYLRRRKRNQYGIIGPAAEPATIIRVAADLSESDDVPSGPSIVQVRPYGEGGFRVDAQYVPDWDEIGFRANQWLIYYTTDGTDPDPDTDTPTVQAMDYDTLGVGVGRVTLKKAFTTSELEDTPIKVLVRTRRHVVDPAADYESENTDLYSTTLEYCGPQRPEGHAVYRNTLGQYLAPPSFTPFTVVIDAGNNIYWECKPGQSRLWADTYLIWNFKRDSLGDSRSNGWYTQLAWDFEAVSAVGSADGVDVLSWTVGDKRLGFNVNGQLAMVVDVTNGLIKTAMIDTAMAPSGSCQDVPMWLKYADSCFMVYDPSTTRWVAAASIDANGMIKSAVPIYPALTQAECL